MDLAELSDRAEIIDLITAYTRALDTRKYADAAAVFTGAAVLDYSAFGGPAAEPGEALAWVAEMLGGFDRCQHVIGQVALDLYPAGDRDAARATAYFSNPMVARASDGSETLVEVGGYYHHDLVRTAEGWRSARMVDEMVWTR